MELRGTADDPDIGLSLQMRNAVFNEYRTPLVEATVAYRGRRVTGQLSTYRMGDRIVEVGVELPMDLSLRSASRRRLPGPLSVRARASDVDLALLSAVSPLIRQTEGRLTADLGIEGTWEEPRLTGRLDIRDGAATLPALGVRHRAVHAAISLAERVIRVDSLSAESGAGVASASGTVRLEGLTRPVLDLRIRARDFRALDIPDFLTLVTSGEVTLQGPVFGAVLTGTGTIPRGTVHFADIVQKNVVDLTDTLLALDTASAAALRAGHLGPDFQNRFLDSVRIRDLELTMGGDVHLRSSEADIFLEGRVLVQKEADRYRLDGTLRTPRGTYQLTVGPTIRKPFTVTRGEVRYFGTTDLNAALDIDARHQLRGQRGENVVVFVHVGGTLLAPQLTLTSDVEPPLTNEEIISYLVIGAPNVQSGRSVGRYGVEESISTLTAQVTGQLSSQLMGDLGVPLDYLEIRPQFGLSGVEATEVAVGRQISDRWFVKLNPRFCSKQAFTAQNLGGSLEFRMSREWSFLASADPVEVCSVTAAGVGRLQLGFDLLWEKRF
jgi:translocation and assembly module TamB